MRDQLVLRIVCKILLPFIFLFGLYVLMHGKYSPGGGFQAGAILAAGFIIYALIFGVHHLQRVVSLHLLKWLSAVGVFMYVGVAIGSLFLGGNLLNYNVYFENPLVGQFWMIMIVELAIGLSVTCVLTSIFIAFATHSPDAVEEAMEEIADV